MRDKDMKFSEKWQFIIAWFLATRIILTIVGVLARCYINSPHVFSYINKPWLAIWGVWDSGWYLNIAQQGYSAITGATINTINQANYAFFPLYPALIAGLGKLIGNYYIAGIIISNISLIIACSLLYEIVSREFGKKIAKLSVKYLFLFPVAFIFSGIFSESLFLRLVLASFSFSQQLKWWKTGLVSSFTTLTRPMGIFVAIPLIFEYLEHRKFKIKSIRLDILAFGLPVISMFLFVYYIYGLTKDWLALLNVQVGWGRIGLYNPLLVLWGGLHASEFNIVFSAIFTVLAIILLVVGYKKLKLSYTLYSVILLSIPLLTSVESMPRYILVIFPIFIILGLISCSRKIDVFLSVLLGITQIVLMIFWTTGFDLVK